MNKQNGFTLIELAISLMVIGLLIGGVLKGQELINNARITRHIKDLTDYDTAVMIFRSSYNALPGDIRNPSSRLPNCTITGSLMDYPCAYNLYTGDGQIGETFYGKRNFWIHMQRAGLITGVNEEPYKPWIEWWTSPLTKFDTYLAPVWAASGSPFITPDPQLNYLFTPFTLGISEKLDQKMDDGKALTGYVIASPTTGYPGTAGETCHNLANTSQYDTNKAKLCSLYVKMDSMNP